MPELAGGTHALIHPYIKPTELLLCRPLGQALDLWQWTTQPELFTASEPTFLWEDRNNKKVNRISELDIAKYNGKLESG